MAKGYPARQQEAEALPECPACGSHRFREGTRGLQCEDCLATVRDPFKA